jgi:hypothetical protein
MGRSDAILLGSTRTTYHENDLSRWYASRIQPQHTHVWEPFSNVATRNVFGETIGGGTGRPASIPMRLLSASEHREFLEHVKDIRALEELFTSIHADEGRVDLDPAEEGKGFVIVNALREWQAAGYPGTWEDWWARWWDDWVSWMHSEGRNNFWQWRALRSKERACSKK